MSNDKQIFNIKKIILGLTVLITAIALTLGMGMKVFAKPKKKLPKPSRMRTYVTYNKMYVGETISLKVAPRKATIKVRFLPNKSQKTGVSVKTSNSRILKPVKVNKYSYKLKALKKGNVTITIKSRKTGKNGKKLITKLRMRVLNRKPIESITAIRNGASSIRLIFDKAIKDKFNKSLLSIQRYDENNEKSLGSISIKNFEYDKDDNSSVIINTISEIMSNSTYRIKYDKLFTILYVGNVGVENINLATKTVPKGEPTLLDIRAFDSEGKDITDTGYFKEDKLKVEIASSTGSAKLQGKGRKITLLMLESGSKANIDISYDSKAKKTFEVTCDDNVDKALYNLYKSTIVHNTLSANWDDVSEKDNALLDTNSTDAFVAMLAKTSDGKLICNRKNDRYFEPTATFEYSVHKGSKLKIDEKTGAVSAKKPGFYTAIIKMTYKGNTYQYTVPIKAEAQKPGLINLNPSTVIVSNRNGVEEVEVDYRDIYGNIVEERDMKITPSIRYSNADAEASKKYAEPTRLAGLVDFKAGKKLTLVVDGRPNGFGVKPAGTYYYEISVESGGKSRKDPKIMVKAYLTVKVQDTTGDVTGWDYKFKEVLENREVDMNISNLNSFAEIEKRAQGFSLGLYSYNQFDTSISLASAYNYKINGKSINLSTMPYIENRAGEYFFVPYKVEDVVVNGITYKTVKKLADKGSYQITAECYDEKIKRVRTFNCAFVVIDTQPLLGENTDFKVKRSGVGGATTILQNGMAGTPSQLAVQLVTKMDDSAFIPEVTATGFDARYPSSPVGYMSMGNTYVIDKVKIPVQVVTRDGIQVYVYLEHPLYITLGQN